MSNVIQFQIIKEDTGYSAVAINFPIVTQAETLDELEHNIKEATELFFEDNIQSKHLFSNPSIFMNYESPLYA